MLFSQPFWAGIADGTITLTFRRWKRCQVVAGRPYRTPAGRIHVEAVDVVTDVSADEAARSGFASRAELLGQLRGDGTLPIYRIAFHLLDEPDPRAELAATDDIDEAALAELTTRLGRLDRASSRGPWTDDMLRLIAANPAVRAADLAASQGRETQPFKLDVRKLKALGLTISLERGYRLSPRGEAYVRAATRSARRSSSGSPSR